MNSKMRLYCSRLHENYHPTQEVTKITLSSKAFLVVILSLVLFNCADKQLPLADGSLVVLAEGIYVHPPSGMKFPENVGPFQRKRIIGYDRTGHYISVRYNLVNAGREVAATIYIYPGPEVGENSKDLSQRHFDALKAHIAGNHPGARLVYEGDIQLDQEGEVLRGKKASFRFEDVFAFKVEQLTSHAYLFRRDKWFIEYRITYPQVLDDTVGEDVGKFMSFFLETSAQEWLKNGVEE